MLEEQIDYAEESQPRLSISDILQAGNLVSLLSEDEVSKISYLCKDGYEKDVASRSSKAKLIDDAMELVTKVVSGSKSFPFEGCADVRIPLISSVSLQFASRVGAAVLKGKDIVKAKIVGADNGSKAAKGARIAQFMSYQLQDDMKGWLEDTDQLLCSLPICGVMFRKTYIDTARGKVCSEIIYPKYLVVNDAVKDIYTAPRITHEVQLYPYQIEERIRSGEWEEIDYTKGDEKNLAPVDILEQHTFLDLDEDGYQEPYVVTFLKDSSKVFSIYPRFNAEDVKFKDGRVVCIDALHWFTKYTFMKAFDGSFYGLGFGELLYALNKTVNSIANIFLDAGTLANAGGGLIGKNLRLRGGELSVKPGKYLQVDTSGMAIAENIYQFKHPEPSSSLFSMIGFLMESAKDVSGAREIITDSGTSDQAALTTMAMVEEGARSFKAIYKRFYLSLKEELRKIFILNGRYLEESDYRNVLDKDVSKADFETTSIDIVPVADPEEVVDFQKFNKAQLLMQFMSDPYMNHLELRSRILDAAGIENIESLLMAPQQDNTQTVLAERESERKDIEVRAKATKAYAESTKLLAEAEAAEVGNQLQEYSNDVENIRNGVVNG